MLDPLSLFFLATILLISIPAAIYSIGYMKKEYSPGKVLLGQVLTLVFVVSMMAVVTVSNALAFLVDWFPISWWCSIRNMRDRSKLALYI